MRGVEPFEGVRLPRDGRPVAGWTGTGERLVFIYALHRIGENTKARSLPQQRHAHGVLVATTILMFVADHDRIAPCHGGGDHGMSLQEAGHLQRHMRVAVLILPGPGSRVWRQAQSGVISRRDLCHEAIDRADFDT